MESEGFKDFLTALISAALIEEIAKYIMFRLAVRIPKEGKTKEWKF